MNGQDALKSVCDPKGSWDWCLIGADPEALPLAGGGSGFIDEMRACLEEYGGSVLTGILRMSFGEIQGENMKAKWIVVFFTLDGQESTMSAVQRGKALGKRPAMEKAFGQYCKVITDTWEVTSSDQLTQENIMSRVKKAAVIDGALHVPKWDPKPFIQYEPPPTASKVEANKSEMVEEYEPEADANAANHAPKIHIRDGEAAEVPMGATATEAQEPAEEAAPAPAAAAAEEPAKEEAKAEEPAAKVTCSTGGCERPSWNGEAGQTCCRTCGNPELATKLKCAHGPECEAKFKGLDPLSAAALVKKESEKNEEKKAPDATNVEAALGRFNKGDQVDIWSHTENKWFTDGVIEETRDEASTTVDGKPLPAGAAKIVYSNGQRGKWLQPEILNDRSVVKPSIKPAVFNGFMKKETHNIMSEWHTRHFELRDGFLTWWITIEDAKAGTKPQCSLELVGLQMKATDKSTKISIRSASSRGVVYNFDSNAGTTPKSIEDWVAALKLHAAFANRMYKFRTAASAKK